eukprot:7113257-Alexandrium_andersonii.AAC.1
MLGRSDRPTLRLGPPATNRSSMFRPHRHPRLRRRRASPGAPRIDPCAGSSRPCSCTRRLRH